MNSMQKLNSAIEEFRLNNDHDYNEILVSKSFYNHLQEESHNKKPNYTDSTIVSISSVVIGVPRMKIIENLGQDFIVK